MIKIDEKKLQMEVYAPENFVCKLEDSLNLKYWISESWL